jgi:aspartate oxidase
VLEDGFPTVTAACRKYGVDPVTEYIPVAPGAHYACGGIRADLDGRTSVPGLYAVGEAASTGVHGANRLASNSLVESVIAGRRAGSVAASAAAALSPKTPAPNRMNGTSGRPEAAVADIQLVPPQSRPVLAAAMSRYAGVMRDREGLQRLMKVLEGAPAGDAPFDLASVEAASLRTVSALIAAAALRRTESRGSHRRGDAPETARSARHTLVRCDGGRIHLDWEEA